MKTLVCIAALVCLSCAAPLAQSSDSSAATPETVNKGSRQGPCATPNPGFGYVSDLKLAKSPRGIKVYNVDYPDTHKHDPICLSKKADDAILWLSGSSKKFKLKVYAAKDQEDAEKCGPHPFLKDPPTDTTDGYFSGSLKPDVPDYCVYEVEFQIEGGKVSDPHIRVDP